MSFIDSYKRLEKLCSEMYGEMHGVSIYIDEMIKNPGGSYFVQGWNEDLKQLKHYRWVRNQIIHEPGCTEENMCVPYDEQWINDFYSRIMATNDPLALYRKARNQRSTENKAATQKTTTYTYPEQRVSKQPIGCFTYLMGILLVAVAVVLTLNIV